MMSKINIPKISDKKLYKHNYLLYWLDHSISLSLFLISVFLYYKSDATTLKLFAFSISVIFLYRSLIFIHEIVHFTKSSYVPGFSSFWNITCGIPFLIPTFMYKCHLQHHGKCYSTINDPEYLPFVSYNKRQFILFMLHPFVLPFLLYLRFTLLTFLSYFFNRVRLVVDERFSSLAINPLYRHKTTNNKKLLLNNRIQESLCFIYLTLVSFAVLYKYIALNIIIYIYFVVVFILFINSLRTLVAHRYNLNQNTNIVGQVNDSINHDHGMFAFLWAPIGLRFHALHHMYQSIPYHNLSKLHRILANSLLYDSFYQKCSAKSLFDSLKRLIYHKNNEK